MNFFKVFISVTVLICSLAACTFEESDTYEGILDISKLDTVAEKKLVKKKFSGEKKDYYKGSGKLRNLIQYKNGYREGKSINFYENGKACVEANFVKGEMTGKYAWYYETGKPYLIINYNKGQYHGFYAQYNANGYPVYKANFNNGQPCKGMVVYSNGQPQPYLKLSVQDLGYNFNKEVYTLKLNLNQTVKDVHFYSGALSKDGCFDINLINDPIYTEEGTSLVEIPLRRGEYIMNTVNFVALVNTKYDIETVVETSFNLSAEAR